VNYGRYVGFKEQLGFFEFCYELALANHAKKKLENRCAPIFSNMGDFWAKHKIFKLDVEDPTVQTFIFCAQKS
jgi:hypothetical protein